MIVPWEADHDPTLLEICGSWSVTAVDFTPLGPCCLPGGHMTITTDRDQRQHQRRDQAVKILAPDSCQQLVEICTRHGWHLRRSRDRVHWFASHIDLDGVYRRLWPAVDNREADPDLEWVWGASHDGSHLGSGTGPLAACLAAACPVHPRTPGLGPAHHDSGRPLLMLNDATVTMLTDALIRTEAVADQRGWNNPPALLGLFAHHSPRLTAIEVTPYPIDPKVWRLPDPDQPGETLPPPVVLGSIAGTLATASARPRYASWLRRNGRRFLGAAFVCEAYHAAPYPGYEPGDLNAVPAMADAEIRLLTALDLDHRLYQITRTRGHDQPGTTVLHPAPPQHADTTIGEAMYALVNLGCDLQPEHRNGAQP